MLIIMILIEQQLYSYICIVFFLNVIWYWSEYFLDFIYLYLLNQHVLVNENRNFCIIGLHAMMTLEHDTSTFPYILTECRTVTQNWKVCSIVHLWKIWLIHSLMAMVLLNSMEPPFYKIWGQLSPLWGILGITAWIYFAVWWLFYVFPCAGCQVI